MTCKKSLRELTLHIADWVHGHLPSDFTFSKIEKLSLWCVDIAILTKLSKESQSLTNLTMYHIVPDVKDQLSVLRDFISSIVMAPLMQELSIEDIKYDYFDCICNGIEKGLYSLKQKKQKIQINIELGKQRYINEIIANCQIVGIKGN